MNERWRMREESFVCFNYRRPIVVVGNVYLNFLVCVPSVFHLNLEGDGKGSDTMLK